MEYKILPADEFSLAKVCQWLDEEKSNYAFVYQTWIDSGYEGDQPFQGFRCNWDSQVKAWHDGYASIYILFAERNPVGFRVGTDILEVKPDVRGKGYGRILAEHMIEEAYREGQSIIEIEIAPSTVQPFWERMGFSVVSERNGRGGGIYAYKILPRIYNLGAGERVPYSVKFFAEEEYYSSTHQPLTTFSGFGERLVDGFIQLPERAYCFQPYKSGYIEYFVQIGVNGIDIHSGPLSELPCGVELDVGSIYFIDRLKI